MWLDKILFSWGCHIRYVQIDRLVIWVWSYFYKRDIGYDLGLQFEYKIALVLLGKTMLEKSQCGNRHLKLICSFPAYSILFQPIGNFLIRPCGFILSTCMMVEFVLFLNSRYFLNSIYLWLRLAWTISHLPFLNNY